VSSDVRAAAVLLALAGALLLWAPRRASRRVPVGRPGGGLRTGTAPRPRRGPSERQRRRLLAAAAGMAVGLLAGGPTGLVLAGMVTVGGERLLRRTSADGRSGARPAVAGDLPAACDLLGVCLAAGVPVAGALAAVGDAVPGAVGAHLRTVAALYRLGAEPRRAWEEVPVELAGLGRLLVRAGESGSAVVPALRSLAADSRSTARAAAASAVQRAGVWVLAPLGVCFLPAFLCLGVVPLVLGIAGDVFG
jgi:Flp pilus assembly protein TadB